MNFNRYLGISSYYRKVVETLSISSRDYSYLKDKLPNTGGDTYPVVYFKDDLKKDYPIYVNLEGWPLFAFKPKDSGDGKKPCDGEYSQKPEWVSGNKICQDAAFKLGKSVETEDDTEAGAKVGYTWFNYIRYEKDGKLVRLPEADTKNL